MDRINTSIHKDESTSPILIFIYRLLLILSHGFLWLLKMTDVHITYLYHSLHSKWINIDSKVKECLTRIPVNLAICIGLEDSKQIDINIIVQLLTWCHSLSIKTLTIYHYCDSFPELPNNLKGIEIQTISLRSSHQSFIKFSRQICQSTSPSSKITNDQICDHLRQNGYYKFDDPDLLLCFSHDQRSLQAFPPWQLRLTEIIFLTTHRHLNKSLFLSILKRYSRCEQRFGK